MSQRNSYDSLRDVMVFQNIEYLGVKGYNLSFLCFMRCINASIEELCLQDVIYCEILYKGKTQQ